MYVLDTNAVYYLVDEAWTSRTQLETLQERAESGKFKVALSPITVLEMSSRIIEEPSWFGKVQLAAEALLSLSPCALPDPEQRMREVVADITFARQAYQHWHGILETIARAPNADALQLGYDDYGTATRRSANIRELHRFRADYERQYVDDMLCIVKQLNPNFDKQVLNDKRAVLSSSEQAALRSFFSSPEWNATFLAGLAYRGDGTLPTDTGKLGNIVRKFQFFQLAYETLALKTFCDGYRPSLKRKNDYNDIHQLLYVNDFDNNIIVTEDSGVLSQVGSPSGKVISLKEFLVREASA